MRRLIAQFRRDDRGSAAIQMSLLCGLMIVLTGGAVETGYLYHQKGSAEHAVRHGARLAALTDPVSVASIGQRTSYDITCRGATQSCSAGAFDRAAFERIVYGADGDGTCAATTGDRRGLCDVYTDADPSRVSVRYRRSGANTSPIITVTLEARPLSTLIIGPWLPKSFTQLPDISASHMGEDLDG